MKTASLIFITLTLSLSPSFAQSKASQQKTVPYDERLMRLSEILGSLHYLDNLCGNETKDWREQMDLILKTENPSNKRRARLTANFNRGYRSYAAIHEFCTDSSKLAIKRYLSEGSTLSRELIVRFSG